MLRVTTETGEVVTLECFPYRPCVIEILLELQRTIPRCELSLHGGRYMQVRLLNFDREMLQALNVQQAA